MIASAAWPLPTLGRVSTPPLTPTLFAGSHAMASLGRFLVVAGGMTHTASGTVNRQCVWLYDTASAAWEQLDERAFSTDAASEAGAVVSLAAGRHTPCTNGGSSGSGGGCGAGGGKEGSSGAKRPPAFFGAGTCTFSGSKLLLLRPCPDTGLLGELWSVGLSLPQEVDAAREAHRAAAATVVQRLELACEAVAATSVRCACLEWRWGWALGDEGEQQHTADLPSQPPRACPAGCRGAPPPPTPTSCWPTSCWPQIQRGGHWCGGRGRGNGPWNSAWLVGRGLHAAPARVPPAGAPTAPGPACVQEVYQGPEPSCSVQGLAPATELVFALKARWALRRSSSSSHAWRPHRITAPAGITNTSAPFPAPCTHSFDDGSFLWSEPILVTTPAGGRKPATAAGAKG